MGIPGNNSFTDFFFLVEYESHYILLILVGISSSLEGRCTLHIYGVPLRIM